MCSNSLKLIISLPIVNITRQVRPRPSGVLLATLLSDLQIVASEDVRPTRTDSECPCTASPDPITVMLPPPGRTKFDTMDFDTTPVSTDTIPVVEPTPCPEVTITSLELEIECAGWAITVVSEVQTVSSQCVCPIRTTGVKEQVPTPLPCMITACCTRSPAFA